MPADPPRVLPPIRTFTVGPGVSPGPPIAGCGRVADCHRRFGVSPTPEHAVARASVWHVTDGVATRGPIADDQTGEIRLRRHEAACPNGRLCRQACGVR